MRGQKPKPTVLKVIRGNPGRRPLNKNEPFPQVQLPEPPAELNDDARTEWGRVSRELYNLGMLTGLDRGVLAAYCQSYGRWQQAERRIAELAREDELSACGLLNRTAAGNYIQAPLVGVANKAMRDMVRYSVELGMTPSARSRITAQPPRSVDPAAKYFGSD